MRNMRNISFETAVLMSTVLLGANSHVRRDAARTATVTPPTPRQLAIRERDEWNKQVEAKKAAKRAAKVSDSSPVGAERKEL